MLRTAQRRISVFGVCGTYERKSVCQGSVRSQFVGQPILAAAGFQPALGRDDAYCEPPGKAAAGKIACPTFELGKWRTISEYHNECSLSSRCSALALLLFSVCAFGAPCTTATTDCTEWLTFGGGPSRSLLYRTYPLEGGHENITRALIVIH